MCQEDFGDELMTIPHEVVRTSGLPGVYDILQCKQCGLACRVSPVEVTFGRYQPDGGVLWKFDKVECTAALNHPDAELYPAYDYLFKMFKKSNEFRDVFPGHWPQIDVGIWGTPMIRLWDGWSIELDQCVVAIWHQIPDCGCGHGPCSPRVSIHPMGYYQYVRAHGLLYHDQHTEPPELAGWRQFRDLAMMMYDLPQPDDTRRRKWFGRYWNDDLSDAFRLITRGSEK